MIMRALSKKKPEGTQRGPQSGHLRAFASLPSSVLQQQTTVDAGIPAMTK